MAPRSATPRLHDILEHIAIVREAVTGRDLEQFSKDPILRLAVERAIEIVSEATRHVPDELQARHPLVPWRNIKAIGNKLRHEYQRVDADIIWDIAIDHLPALKPVIESILQELQNTAAKPLD